MLNHSQRQAFNPRCVKTRSNMILEPEKRRNINSNIRVLRTNLVYAIGLWPQICSQSILKGETYFGKYGKVLKVALSKKANFDKKGLRQPTFSAVITYEDEVAASLAVISLFEFKSQLGTIRCCYGCSKYCEIFMNGGKCKKSHCFYMHHYDKKLEINLDNGQRYLDYDFEKHFSMAADIVLGSMTKITQTFNIKRSIDLFPAPYQGMKNLISQTYLTSQQYQTQWQSQNRCNSKTILSTSSQQTSSFTKQKSLCSSVIDLQQSICNKIITKIHTRIPKAQSKMDFVTERATSPRFIQKFKRFFTEQSN